MGKRVFISYCHKQIEWVRDRLIPCLRAGGAEMLIDFERFQAGRALVGQMDVVQDSAEVNVLVLSADYLNSDFCIHEMNRAIDRDPNFETGSIIPVLKVGCCLPDKIIKPNPLYINLLNDKNFDQWEKLLNACDIDLGTSAVHWLEVRDELCRYLQRNESVNLVVSGNPKWEKLIEHLRQDLVKDLGIVDLHAPATIYRQGLVEEILKAFGKVISVPPEPRDLVILDQMLPQDRVSRLVLKRFEMVMDRADYHYDLNLFATLRYLIMDSRKLVLLAQSRLPFDQLIPKTHTLSSINIKTVEIGGR